MNNTLEERLARIEQAQLRIEKKLIQLLLPVTLEDLEIKELARLTALGNKEAIKNYRKNHKRRTA